MRTLIYNATLILQEEMFSGYLILEDGKITDVQKGKPKKDLQTNESIDAQNQYVAPGFVELHTHGAGGSDFMDGTVSAFHKAALTHMEHGTTTLLPTTLTASREDTRTCIETFLNAKKTMENGPHMPGLHMEGPYLSLEYKGAMNEKFLRDPDSSEYTSLINDYPGTILRWTVAPELPGAMKMGTYLADHGICASIGHSSAEYSQVKEAFYHGYTHVTHLFSAMSSIVRRDGFRFSGVQESAFLLNDMTVEIIADGCHLPPELLWAVWHFKGADHTVLTCDSMRCAGTNASRSFLGTAAAGLPVIIEDDVAKLMDRSGFGGSIATDDRLVRTMYKKAGVPLIDCIRMMSTTPARIIGLGNQKGSIAYGKDADLVFFDDDINISRILVMGKTTYTKNKSIQKGA